MKNKLHIVGIGPGQKDLIHPAAEKIIGESDVLIGGKRNLELFSHMKKEIVVIGSNLGEIKTYIEQNLGKKKIAVIATGDPGIYSVMGYLKTNLADVELEVLPGISSLQYLCSKLGLSWEDMYITSFHGREQTGLKDIIANNDKVAIFTGGNCTPAVVCSKLAGMGLEGIKIAVGENLSYGDERVVEGTPEEIAEMDFKELTLMIVQHKEGFSAGARAWNYTTPGLPDEMFVRGDVPMTKEEIRAVSLSKLRLEKNSIIYDIGAGTGSVSIECALNAGNGKVFAVEKNIEAIELIENNIKKFGVSNIHVIQGEAPYVLSGLPEPDRVFVGGSSGNMNEILGWIAGTVKPVRVVANAVTIESVFETIDGFEKKGFKNLDIASVSVARAKTVGRKHLMQALNPVYIISAEKL